MSEPALLRTSLMRIVISATAVLLAGAVCQAGALQANEPADDDSYVLDQIREVGRPLSSPPAAAARPMPQPLAVSLPRTGFEQRAGSSWTTLAEEHQFLHALDTASDRIRIILLARTLQQRPIQLVIAGPPLTNAQIKSSGAILFVCTQHGDEPAGREACLQLARNHAASTSTTTLLIIPTANPDGVAANTRTNSTHTDINRDHLRLDTREAAAISRVLRTFLPPLASDMHEYRTRAANKVLLKNSMATFPNTDATIVQEVSDANNFYLIPDLNAAGFATGIYGGADTQIRPQRLSIVGPLRHTPVVLVETPLGGALSALQRVRAQLTTTKALLRMWSERHATLEANSNGAAQRAAQEGALGGSRYYFTNTIHTHRPPCAYRLSAGQYDTWKARLDLFGIKALARSGGWSISMAQRTQPINGLLLDSRATAEFTAGQPLPCQ